MLGFLSGHFSAGYFISRVEGTHHSESEAAKRPRSSAFQATISKGHNRSREWCRCQHHTVFFRIKRRFCVGKIGQYTLIEVREAIVWIIRAAGGTRGVLLGSETLCPCLWESCLHNAAGQNTALLSCNRTVYDELFSVSLLAVNFTCASVNGILSLPPTAGVSSTSYLPLQRFVPSCELI